MVLSTGRIEIVDRHWANLIILCRYIGDFFSYILFRRSSHHHDGASRCLAAQAKCKVVIPHLWTLEKCVSVCGCVSREPLSKGKLLANGLQLLAF